MQKGGLLFAFTIPAKPMSWNQLINKNHWKNSELRDYWKNWTMAIAKSLVPKEPYGFPVRLIFRAEWKGKRLHDVDNLYVKSIIDAMRIMGFFVDDNVSYIPEVLLRGFNDCKEDKIIVSCERYV